MNSENLKISLLINAIELAKYNPSATLALKLAKFFAVKVEDIFELEDGD